MAWAAAAFLTLIAFVTVSADDLGDLAWAALHGSAPAMWIAPAILLLSYPERAAQWAALALIAGAACLLTGQRAPRQVATDRVAIATTAPMFQPPRLQRGSLFPVTLGAVALQTGLACTYAGYRLAAAASIAFAAVIWTRSWVARSAAREPRKPRSLWSSLGAVAFAVLLTLGSTVAALDGREQSEDLLQESRRTLARLASPELPKPTAALRPSSPIPITSPQDRGELGPKGVSGVILRPKAKPGRQYLRLLSTAPGTPLVIADQLSFPFTGEYHLFRSASGEVPPDAPVEYGTPLDALYVTVSGGSMETQAYQPLVPPVDFARCGQVHITMRSGEIFPVGATLQLFTDAGLEDLGTQVFGLDKNAQETLPYFVPAAAKRPPVRALRLVFRHDPSRAARSTRIEIVSFTLVPRGY